MTSRPTLNNPRHTAVHEAGHAVVGRALGLVMGQASVEQDDDSAGHSITADPWITLQHWHDCDKLGREFRSVIRARVLMLMGGGEAELAEFGEIEDGGDGDDRRWIAICLDDNPRDAEPRMRRFAKQLVRRHRGTIERVAAELAANGTIIGPDLDDMVPGPKLIRQPQWWDEPLPTA